MIASTTLAPSIPVAVSFFRPLFNLELSLPFEKFESQKNQLVVEKGPDPFPHLRRLSLFLGAFYQN